MKQVLAVLLVSGVIATAQADSIFDWGISEDREIINASNATWVIEVPDNGYGNVWFNNIKQKNGRYILKPHQQVAITYTSTGGNMEGEILVSDLNQQQVKIKYFLHKQGDIFDVNEVLTLRFKDSDKARMANVLNINSPKEASITIVANQFAKE